jgi:hypothetical protein
MQLIENHNFWYCNRSDNNLPLYVAWVIWLVLVTAEIECFLQKKTFFANYPPFAGLMLINWL